MQQVNLKDEVLKVFQTEWLTFAQDHPHLAAAIDQTVLVEQAITSIGDDPAYQQAMEEAATANLTTGAVSDVVLQYIANWVKRILGISG